MSDGFLADLGLDTVDGDPYRFPDSTYPGYMTAIAIKPYSDASKGKFIAMTFKVADGPHKGKTAVQRQSFNKHDNETNKSRVKKMFLDLGVPENRISSIQPEDVIGTPVWFTSKTNGDFVNVNNVRVREEGEGTDATAGEVMGTINPVSTTVNAADLM